jgi:hypothetical protein
MFVSGPLDSKYQRLSPVAGDVGLTADVTANRTQSAEVTHKGLRRVVVSSFAAEGRGAPQAP